jgi:hypothetical protein
MDRAELLARIQSFLTWLDGYGETSQDPYDFWANPIGRRAKRVAYEHWLAGLALAAPFVLLDAAVPWSRVLFRGKRRFPIADAHYAMGFFALAASGARLAVATDPGPTPPRAPGAAPGSPAGPAAAPRVDRAAALAPPGPAAPGVAPVPPASADAYLAAGRHYLAALVASRAPGFQNAGWGYPFDWEGWFGTFKAGTPFITTTAYAYEAFEQGYVFTGDPGYLDTMVSIARFAYHDLTEQEVAPAAYASSYGPFDRRQVVNASAYRAFLLTRAGQRFGRDDWLETARGNLAFVLHSRQRDGSWLYAMEDQDRFVDNFHTCLVLKNLVKIWQANGDQTVLDAVREGYAFYKRNLLDDKGLPVPFAQAQRLNLVRRELYDLAEGINLAVLMRGLDPDAESIGGRLLTELLDNWTLPDGHFVTRVTWFGKNKVPYHRWAQAQTFYALTRVLLEGGVPTASGTQGGAAATGGGGSREGS